MASNFGAVSHLLPPSYKRMVAEWLEEDCPSFDYGGFVVGEEVKEARLLGKSAVGLLFALILLSEQEELGGKCGHHRLLSGKVGCQVTQCFTSFEPFR